MADTSTTTAWIALSGTSFGVLIGFLGQFFAASATTKREREARTEARRDEARQRQNEFQRETLLSLQDSALQLMKLVNVMLAYVKAREVLKQEWNTDYPIETTEQIENEYFNARRLGVRVLDTATRESASKLVDVFGDIFAAEDNAKLYDSVRTFHNSYSGVMKSSGERLRTLEQELIEGAI